MKTKYDAIIIGAGMGGLSASTQLSNNGKSVLVLEQRSEIGGKAAKKDVDSTLYDPGPSIIIMKWIYENYFSSLNESLKDHINFLPISELMSVAYKNKQYSFPQGRDTFLKFIQTEFPDDLKGFEWLLKTGDILYPKLQETIFAQPYSNLFSVISDSKLLDISLLSLLQPFKHLVEKKFSSPEIKAWLYDFPTYLGHTDSQISPGSFMILYSMITEGVWYPENGIYTIPESLAKLTKKYGGKIKTNTQVSRIEKTKNRNWLVSTDKNQYETKVLISNIDPIATQKLFTSSQIKKQKKPKPSFSYCTLTYKFNKKITLPHHLLHVPENWRDAYKNLFNHSQSADSKKIYYLNFPHASDTKTANYAFVVAPVSTKNQDEWQKYLESLDIQVKSDFKNLHKLTAEPTLVFTQTPETFQKRDGNPEGSLFGAGYFMVNMLPQRNTDAIFENLYYVGGAVQPGAGLPMTLLSGKMVADLCKTSI